MLGRISERQTFILGRRISERQTFILGRRISERQTFILGGRISERQTLTTPPSPGGGGESNTKGLVK